MPSTVENTFGHIPLPAVPPPANPDKARTAARRLVECIDKAPKEWSKEAFSIVVAEFTRCAEACGSCATTAATFREAFIEAHGNHLEEAGV